MEDFIICREGAPISLICRDTLAVLGNLGVFIDQREQIFSFEGFGEVVVNGKTALFRGKRHARTAG